MCSTYVTTWETTLYNNLSATMSVYYIYIKEKPRPHNSACLATTAACMITTLCHNNFLHFLQLHSNVQTDFTKMPTLCTVDWAWSADRKRVNGGPSLLSMPALQGRGRGQHTQSTVICRATDPLMSMPTQQGGRRREHKPSDCHGTE